MGDSDDDLDDILRAHMREHGSKSGHDLEALRRRIAEARKKQKAERRKPTESNPEDQDQPTDYGHDYGDQGEDILGKNVQVWPIARRGIVLMHVRTVGSGMRNAPGAGAGSNTLRR
jgi:hypothetical protein